MILNYPANVVHYAVGTRLKIVKIPDWVINSPPGTEGEVIEPAGHDGTPVGPLVRWDDGSICNVYAGWVEDIDQPPPPGSPTIEGRFVQK